LAFGGGSSIGRLFLAVLISIPGAANFNRASTFIDKLVLLATTFCDFHVLGGHFRSFQFGWLIFACPFFYDSVENFWDCRRFAV
jgi:hypothetical protein